MTQEKDQRQAAALDEYVQRRLRGGEPSPPRGLDDAEARLADQLLAAAEETEPTPAFRRRLAADLAAAARQQQEESRRSSFASLTARFLRRITMKRTLLSAAAVAAVALILLLGWPLLRSLTTPDETDVIADLPTLAAPAPTPAAGGDAVADAAPTPGVETLPPAAETLPALPRPQGGGGAADSGGFGGGLGTEGGDMTSMPAFFDVFSQTNFLLTAELPAGPASYGVRQQQPQPMTLEAARSWADRFGFSGPLYEFYFPDEPGAPDRPVDESGFGTVYLAFDGPRQLIVESGYVNFSDMGLLGADPQQMAYDQAAPLAQAWLEARGLLDFPYERRRSLFSPEVEFAPLFDGVPALDPLLRVWVTPDGGIASVFYEQPGAMTVLGEYPLRSAAEAWALLQDPAVRPTLIQNLLPVQSDLAPPPAPQTYWVPEPVPGATTTLLGWPQAYLPAGGVDAPPYIQLGQFVLAGDRAVLEGLLAAPRELLLVSGQVGPDGRTLLVADWQAAGADVFMEQFSGTVRRSADGAFLDTADGRALRLDNAPADLPEGQPVQVYGVVAGEQLVWDSLQIPFEPDTVPAPESLPLVPPPGGPEPVAEVTFDSVRLVFLRTPIFDDDPVAAEMQVFTPPRTVWQPVWEFSGVADSGAAVYFLVPAIDPAFLTGP